jgi:hypothetical protein
VVVGVKVAVALDLEVGVLVLGGAQGIDALGDGRLAGVSGTCRVHALLRGN